MPRLHGNHTLRFCASAGGGAPIGPGGTGPMCAARPCCCIAICSNSATMAAASGGIGRGPPPRRASSACGGCGGQWVCEAPDVTGGPLQTRGNPADPGGERMQSACAGADADDDAAHQWPMCQARYMDTTGPSCRRRRRLCCHGHVLHRWWRMVHRQLRVREWTESVTAVRRCDSISRKLHAPQDASTAEAARLDALLCALSAQPPCAAELTSRSCSCVLAAPPKSWLTRAPTALDGPAPSPPEHMSLPVTSVRSAILAQSRSARRPPRRYTATCTGHGRAAGPDGVVSIIPSTSVLGSNERGSRARRVFARKHRGVDHKRARRRAHET